MKNFALFSVMLATLSLSSCLEEETSKNGNEDIIPSNIEQSGVRGSWGHVIQSPTDLAVAKEIYITRTYSVFVSRCNFAGGQVVAGVKVNSKISGTFLTLSDSANKLVQDGEQTCYAEVTKNSAYGLSLVSENVLDVTYGDTTTRYTRIDND